ncbi:Glycoside catalytic core [Cordyceps militaris]|uniref:chitinase n=1 Tax=Cordyceps militaris TaxID=73501 RepID=A0A2H4SFG4_CORMI|nr:Glycoside catalytic core [Cordyceps militaris]
MQQQLSFSALTLVTLLLAAKAQESHGVETETIYQDSILDEAPTVVGNKDYLEEPPRTRAPSTLTCTHALAHAMASTRTKPMLIDVALYNPLDDEETITVIRACTQGNANSRVNAAFGLSNVPEFHNAPFLNRRNILSRPRRSSLECPVGKDRSTVIQLSMSGSSPNDGHLDAAVFLLHQVLELFQESATCHTKSMLGYLNGTVVGVYAGTSINKASVHSVLEEITPLLTKEKVANATAQICDSRGSASDVVGVAISSNGDLAVVQDALRLWDRVDCAANLASAQELPVVIQAESHLAVNQTMTSNTALYINHTGSHVSELTRRGSCQIKDVQMGDGCWKLAASCGISLQDLKKYNPDKGLCDGAGGLLEGMQVCCSEGGLPDRSKKPDKDGYCASYYVQPTDTCAKIATANGITTSDLAKFNEGRHGTWGWAGCGVNLQAYINICVSEGLPPMPAPIANALINISCISNCGMSIVSSGPPAAYGRVGYYESWNFERNCLYLKAEHANTDGTYTIIHWAFMEIDTENWKPKIKDPHGQWEGFKSLTGVKKVISFGGWGYSTAPETYNILRQAMSPTHRLQFAGNVVKFIIEHGLDGVDFDWEYPGATDIPDTPPGSPEDGQNYLAFLIVMSNKIHRQPPYHYTLSIAAPASFWYLKAFPIEVMSWYLDYIVYMTYDLHGQWDAGNQWSTEGCPAGNCLRSHINLTETETALAMITKAGVPSKRIYVGEASYGRSFKMSHEGCDGPDCTFEGDRMHSQAAPGICTDTSGYISYAEISRIIENDSSSRPWHDHDSNSDIMVYQETEWVAYMTPTTKDTRRNFWKGKNFAGTIDWAVDLMSYHSDDESFGHGEDWSSEFEGGTISPGECKGTYASLEDIEKDRDSIPLHCRDEYTLVALSFILKDSISKHDELIQDHYDHNFGVYAEAVANGAQNTVKDFMDKNASEFFTCQVTEVVDSCKHCWDSWIRKGNNRDKTRLCRYCEDYVCGSTVLPMICWEMNVPCPDPLHQFLFREKDFACPPDFSERSDEPDKDNLIRSSTRWTLKEGKSDAFYAALLAGTDVSSDKIVWEDVRWHDADGPPSYHAHEPMYMDFNFPNPKYYKKEDVMNPKEVINKGREKLNSIMPTIDDVLGLVQQNKYAGLVGDLVDALSVPIAMAQQSVANMQRANDIGQNINDEQKKNFIILFLTAILFFIPFVGEIAGTIGVLAGVARIITVVGELRAVGLDIYSLVDSKGNDPFAIAGILFAPLALYDVAAVAAAAALRRGMKERQITSIGNEAKQTLDKIDRIKGRKSGDRASCPVKREVEPIKVAWDNALLKSSLNDTPVVRSGLE